MPFSLKKLKDATATATADFMGEEVQLTYKVATTTAPWVDSLQEALEGNKGSEKLLERTLELVVDWDVLDEEEKPLKLDLEALKKIPYPYVGKMVRACVTDAAAGSEDEKNA